MGRDHGISSISLSKYLPFPADILDGDFMGEIRVKSQENIGGCPLELPFECLNLENHDNPICNRG